MTTLLCFDGPIYKQLAETAPDDVICIPMDKTDFKDIVAKMKFSVEYEKDHVVFVMGDLKRITPLFKIISPSFYFNHFDKVTMIFPDGSKPQWLKPMMQLSRLANKVVVMDSFNKHGCYLPIKKDYWHTGEVKDIDVAFYGSTDIYPERKNTLAYLRQAGIDIQHSFVPDMMEALRRTKITFNFGNCLSGNTELRRWQIKGRIWEAAMAKCVVIEPLNEETEKIFTNNEIIWYSDMKEIPGLVNMLLKDNDFRDYVAENAFQKAKQYADPDIYWGRLL